MLYTKGPLNVVNDSGIVKEKISLNRNFSEPASLHFTVYIVFQTMLWWFCSSNLNPRDLRVLINCKANTLFMYCVFFLGCLFPVSS